TRLAVAPGLAAVARAAPAELSARLWPVAAVRSVEGDPSLATASSELAARADLGRRAGRNGPGVRVGSTGLRVGPADAGALDASAHVDGAGVCAADGGRGAAAGERLVGSAHVDGRRRADRDHRRALALARLGAIPWGAACAARADHRRRASA